MKVLKYRKWGDELFARRLGTGTPCLGISDSVHSCRWTAAALRRSGSDDVIRSVSGVRWERSGRAGGVTGGHERQKDLAVWIFLSRRVRVCVLWSDRRVFSVFWKRCCARSEAASLSRVLSETETAGITEPDISRWGGGGGVGGCDVWWPGVCDGVHRVMLKMSALPVHRGCGYSILMGGGWKTWWGGDEESVHAQEVWVRKTWLNQISVRFGLYVDLATLLKSFRKRVHHAPHPHPTSVGSNALFVKLLLQSNYFLSNGVV